MNPFEMVVIIVMVGVGAGVVKHWIDRAPEIRKDFDSNTKNDANQQQIAKLEARIQVLERIVVSDGYDLKQKFKDLDQEKQE